MAATTGYQAAAETNDVLLSYLAESTWANTPAAQFQAMRSMGELLTSGKNRQRPGELNATGEVSQAVTTRENAGGAINIGLSYGTYDDPIAGVLGADWQAAQAIAGVAGDITLTRVSATSATLSSGTSNRYSTIIVGSYIRLLGFTNAANNGFFRVAAKPNNQTLTLTSLADTVTETPSGTNAKVRASTITNASLFKSFSVQKKLNASQYLRYAGSFFTGFNLSGSVGAFMSGSLNMIAQSEVKATSDWSTGAVLAAPTGAVHDACLGFGGFYIDEVAPQAGLQSMSLNVTRQGADANYAMGAPTAQGMMKGLLEVTGSAELYFRSFTEYDRYKAETMGRLAFITQDAARNAYVISLLNGALLNPQIVAGGPSQPVLARFQLEGNPTAAGGTIQIDRLPSV